VRACVFAPYTTVVGVVTLGQMYVFTTLFETSAQ
jgi:hypothetical protein